MTDTIDTFRMIYTIIVALALTEAIEKFAKDTDRNGASAQCDGGTVYWARLPALLCVLFLVVPFLQGMNLYLLYVYVKPSQIPPARWLLFDITVFTVYAMLIFVMSRNLSWRRWRVFYRLIAILLGVDVCWSSTVFLLHRSIPDSLVSECAFYWALMNAIFCVLLELVRWWNPKREWLGPMLCCLLVFFRTISDFYVSWDFRFQLPE